MGDWSEGEVLGLDLETTGVDRFSDVPVSYALVSVVDGVAVRSWSGLIDPGCDIPAETTQVHGITTERARTEGMPLPAAVSLLMDAVAAAGRRGAPVAGMRLDYDLTILEVQAARLGMYGLAERGWRGPVLDAAVLDRHFDPEREGRRTLCDLCAHYGVEFVRAHDAWADAVASVQVLFAMAERFPGLFDAELRRLHEDQIKWHREWSADQDGWRSAQGKNPLDPRDYMWPLTPAVLPPAA
jgi:DNA polymerase-3 subunit epsilon